MSVSVNVARFVAAGGWAAAFGYCDDRAVVVRGHDQIIAVIAEATSPTYGGYYTPLGLDLAISAVVDSLHAHRHVCSVECVETAVLKANAALQEIEREHREANPGKGLEGALVAGGTVAERRGWPPGPRLVQWSASMTAAVVSSSSVVVAQIGMCRAYRWRTGALQLLLDDHSLATEMRRRGEELDPAHASVVTRLLGFEERAEIETFPVEAGDRVVLCTDGVWRLGDDVLASALTGRSPSEVTAALEARLGDAPKDDAAAIVIELTSE